jgi:hypothetical protein
MCDVVAVKTMNPLLVVFYNPLVLGFFFCMMSVAQSDAIEGLCTISNKPPIIVIGNEPEALEAGYIKLLFALVTHTTGLLLHLYNKGMIVNIW